MNESTALGRLRPRAGDPADFALMEDRGLIETAAGQVRMTRAGRAAARAGTGAPPDPARGLLSQWSWAALARLHAAGDGGLVIGTSAQRTVPDWERCPPWGTVVRLRNRRVPYVEEVRVNGEWSVRLTPAGREHVEANQDRYAAAYPDAEVPGPASGEALHRADPAQLAADLEHRRRLHAAGNAAAEARAAGDAAGEGRFTAELRALWDPSACGHWRGSKALALRNRAAGASCR
jgi:hypothetical protein